MTKITGTNTYIKVVGQHSYDTLKELVDDLQFLDELKLPNDKNINE